MTISLYRASTAEQFSVEGIPALKGLMAEGKITLDDYCFFPGASDWTLLRQVQILGDRLTVLPPPPTPAPAGSPVSHDFSSSGHHNHTVELGLTVQTRHNVLAYVAFVLGCLSFLFSAIAAIPGLICAQMALKQCDADPSLLGRSWAKAGSILCWIIIIANILVVLCFAVFFMVNFWR